MKAPFDRAAARARRHRRVRGRVQGTAARPRLCVHRSLRHVYAQVIDDQSGRTLAAAGTVEASLGLRGVTAETAAAIGRTVAERALAAGHRVVVFDRAGYQYHGRVRALAEAARAAGLEF